MQRRIYQPLKSRGVVVLGVNCAEQGDPFEKARAFRDKHRLTYPIVVDARDEVRQRYGVRAFPTNVIIDQQGVVRYMQPGFHVADIMSILQDLLNNGE